MAGKLYESKMLGKVRRWRKEAYQYIKKMKDCCNKDTQNYIACYAAERICNLREIVAGPRRLDEQHVGAGFGVSRGALQRRLQAFDCNCVGARHDQRLLARIQRRADLAGMRASRLNHSVDRCRGTPSRSEKRRIA